MSQGKTKISVIVCAQVENKYLKRVIESLIDQSLSKEAYEIIVIYNDALKEIDEIIDSLHGKISNLQFSCVSGFSLTNLMDVGITVAHGDIIVFLDNDVCVSKEWVSNKLKSYEQIILVNEDLLKKKAGESERRLNWLKDKDIQIKKLNDKIQSVQWYFKMRDKFRENIILITTSPIAFIFMTGFFLAALLTGRIQRIIRK